MKQFAQKAREHATAIIIGVVAVTAVTIAAVMVFSGSSEEDDGDRRVVTVDPGAAAPDETGEDEDILDGIDAEELEDSHEESGEDFGHHEHDEGYGDGELTDEEWEQHLKRMEERTKGADQMLDIPADVQERAEGFAEAWVTYDSRASKEDRAKQLGVWISNPERWTMKPALHFTFDEARGNPAWRTVSAVTKAPEMVEDFSFTMNGEHMLTVTVHFDAEFSLAGTHQAEMKGMRAEWSFILGDDGSLKSLEEPDVLNPVRR